MISGRCFLPTSSVFHFLIQFKGLALTTVSHASLIVSTLPRHVEWNPATCVRRKFPAARRSAPLRCALLRFVSLTSASLRSALCQLRPNRRPATQVPRMPLARRWRRVQMCRKPEQVHPPETRGGRPRRPRQRKFWGIFICETVVRVCFPSLPFQAAHVVFDEIRVMRISRTGPAGFTHWRFGVNQSPGSTFCGQRRANGTPLNP
jgi:hypothetical protein